MKSKTLVFFCILFAVIIAVVIAKPSKITTVELVQETAAWIRAEGPIMTILTDEEGQEYKLRADVVGYGVRLHLTGSTMTLTEVDSTGEGNLDLAVVTLEEGSHSLLCCTSDKVAAAQEHFHKRLLQLRRSRN